MQRTALQGWCQPSGCHLVCHFVPGDATSLLLCYFWPHQGEWFAIGCHSPPPLPSPPLDFSVGQDLILSFRISSYFFNTDGDVYYKSGAQNFQFTDNMVRVANLAVLWWRAIGPRRTFLKRVASQGQLPGLQHSWGGDRSKSVMEHANSSYTSFEIFTQDKY